MDEESEVNMVDWLKNEMAILLDKFIRHIAHEHNWDVDDCTHSDEEIYGEAIDGTDSDIQAMP